MALPSVSLTSLAHHAAAATEGQPADAAAPEPAGKGGYGVQLGSFPNSEDASRGWREMKDARPDLFAGLRPVIKDSHGESGARTARLMIGPFENEGSAVELCARFRAAGQECSVRHMP